MIRKYMYGPLELHIWIHFITLTQYWQVHWALTLLPAAGRSDKHTLSLKQDIPHYAAHWGVNNTEYLAFKPAPALNINLDMANIYAYLFRPRIVFLVRRIDQIIIFLILRDEAHHPESMQLKIFIVNAQECESKLRRMWCVVAVIISLASGESHGVGANSDKKLVLESYLLALESLVSAQWEVRSAEPVMSSSHLVITS